MPASEYTAHLIADAVANGTAYQGPATVYLALTKTVPTKTVAGTAFTSGGVGRKTWAQSGWTNDGTGNLENTAMIEWAAASADFEDEVLAVEAYDAATNGNRLWWVELSSPKTIVDDMVPTVLTGDLQLAVV